MEFRSIGDTFCSFGELEPVKITIPSHDTLLLTGVTDNLQLMLHKKQGESATLTREAIADRIFFSENEMDVAEVAAHLNTGRPQRPLQQQQQHHYRQDDRAPVSLAHSGMMQLPVPIPAIEAPRLQQQQQQLQQQRHTPPPASNHQSHHLSVPYQAHHRPVQQQNSFENKTKSELIKTKKFKSVTYREPSPIPDLKRVSSTGTPVLKRQANVVESHYGDEPMTKRAHSEDHPSLYPHLSRGDSLEALRMRADRLDDSLRMHQEILANSPLLKKQMDRHGTGFRHSFNPVKAEPKDT